MFVENGKGDRIDELLDIIVTDNIKRLLETPPKKHINLLKRRQKISPKPNMTGSTKMH